MAQMKRGQRNSTGLQHVAVTAFSPASNQPHDWGQKQAAQHETRLGTATEQPVTVKQALS